MMRVPVQSFWFLVWLVSMAVSFGGGRLLSNAGSWVRSDRETEQLQAQTTSGAQEVEPSTASDSVPATADLSLAKTILHLERHARAYQIALLLRGADAAEFPSLLAEALALSNPARRDELLFAVFERWGAVAPLAAIVAVRPLSYLQRERFTQAVLAGWVRVDPDGAVSWVEAQDDLESRETFPRHMGVFTTLLDDDRLQEAVRLVDQISDKRFQGAAVWHIANRWAMQDPASTLAWLGSLPPGYQRRNAYASALYSVAFEDPAGAAALAEMLPTTDERDSAGHAVMQVWASSDAASARAWLAPRVADPGFQSAVGSYVRSALTKSPELAASMVNEIRDPKSRDMTVSLAIRDLAETSPVDAIEWTLRFLPSAQRDVALDNMFRQWSARDRVQAEAILASSSWLTAEQRSRLQGVVRATGAQK